MHEWLKVQFVKYEQMSETLFNVLKYLKRQEKSRPDECKELVYQFTLAWKIAFPDKKDFNKLHFLITHSTMFAEAWEMMGIVSEESFEAFHNRLQKTKSLLKNIPSHAQRVETINARMQNLLKEEIMELTITVETETTGKKT